MRANVVGSSWPRAFAVIAFGTAVIVAPWIWQNDKPVFIVGGVAAKEFDRLGGSGLVDQPGYEGLGGSTSIPVNSTASIAWPLCDSRQVVLVLSHGFIQLKSIEFYSLTNKFGYVEVWSKIDEGASLSFKAILSFWLFGSIALGVAAPKLKMHFRRQRGLCVVCGYSLTGLQSTRCPECGSEFESKVVRL